ncbi:hypothetical protein OAO01_08070 [Oligoflexia bacterium]|nr:hypothetical protein [Oligoflexia bacterium]
MKSISNKDSGRYVWFWRFWALLGAGFLLLAAAVLYYLIPLELGVGDPINSNPTYPYVAVYGNARCANTIYTRKQLDRAKIPYSYHVADAFKVLHHIDEKVEQAGISEKKRVLPFVDVNGHFLANPSFEEIERIYRDW